MILHVYSTRFRLVRQSICASHPLLFGFLFHCGGVRFLTSYIIHHTSYHTSYIIHHTSYIIHHTSYIIHHTSYIIHHTSYIIYHTSYIIHRHATRICSLFWLAFRISLEPDCNWCKNTCVCHRYCVCECQSVWAWCWCSRACTLKVMFMYLHVCMYVCMYVCVCMYVRVCVCVCKHTTYLRLTYKTRRIRKTGVQYLSFIAWGCSLTNT